MSRERALMEELGRAAMAWLHSEPDRNAKAYWRMRQLAEELKRESLNGNREQVPSAGK